MFTAFKLPTGPALRYGRVSTDDQTVETQHEFMRDYCGRLTELRTRDEDVFLDPDTSGTIPFAERKAGGELLRRIDSAEWGGEPVRHVIVVHIDRLGRNAVDIILTVRGLWERGIIPHWLDQGPVPRTAANELIVNMRAGFAQFERDIIAERTSNKMHVKRLTGTPAGNSLPYGWQAVLPDGTTTTLVATGRLRTPTDPKTRQPLPEVPEYGWPKDTRWIPHPGEQETLRLMRLRKGAGQNYNQIMAWLNAEAIPSKTGKQWTYAAVQSALTAKINQPA